MYLAGVALRGRLRKRKEKKRKEKKRKEVETAKRRRKVQGKRTIPCLVVHDDKTHFCILIRFLLKLCAATTVKDAGNMMTAAGLCYTHLDYVLKASGRPLQIWNSN